MPSKIPRISGEDAIKAFCKAGFRLDRIRGSHHILRHSEKRSRLSIPIHKGHTVGVGLLRSQIFAAGMTVDEFIGFL
ncbi:MAG: type II toxin-antitoxin system HicA family toxin [Pirellulaceae bacterium]|nr:type II toxin-antitoxin system HicA family toxin [Pirellulaceae bacterium]